MGKPARPSGGSALKRLKSTLKDQGLIAPAQKKRFMALKSDKIQKRNTTTKAAVARKSLTDMSKYFGSSNPFETQVSKEKHQVLGRKVKGVVGRPGVSRLKGNENRKNTLLVDLKSRSKVGGVVDKRFGENDPTMSIEDRMLERFSREKQKRVEKSSLYNIESGDEQDEDELTHFGKALSSLQNEIQEHDTRLSDDESESGGIRGKYVDALHFGGFDGEKDGRKKSHSEIMHEVMAKSKFHKHERQKTKEDNEDLRRELNAEFDDISALLMEADKETRKVESIASRNREKDEYDVAVRELMYEKKARPTDRLKTAEEDAQEAAETLRRNERHRVRRMEGLSSDTEASSEEEEVNTRTTHATKRSGGDDLGFDFDMDEDEEEVATLKRRKMQGESEALVYKDGRLVNAHQLTIRPKGSVAAKNDTVGDFEENEYSGDDESASGEGSDDSRDGSDSDAESDGVSESDSENLEEDSDDEELRSVSDDGVEMEKEHTRLSSKISPKHELPFVMECPETHEDLVLLFSGRTLDEQAIIVGRIRALHHISLKPENKAKLISFLLVLFQHLEAVIKFEAASSNEKIKFTSIELVAATVVKAETTGTHYVQQCLDLFIPVIQELSTQFPDVATELYKSRLSTYFESAKRRSPIITSLIPRPIVRAHEWIPTYLFVSLYSSSDFYNSITTPSIMVLAQWLKSLSQRVRNWPANATEYQARVLMLDAATGLSLCSIFCETQQETMRWMPEVYGFLYTLLDVLAPQNGNDVNPLPTFSNDQSNVRSRFGDVKVKESTPLQMFELVFSLGNTSTLPMNPHSLVIPTVKALSNFAKLYVKKELVNGPTTSVFSADSLEDGSHQDASMFVAPVSTSGWCWLETHDPLIQKVQQIAAEKDLGLSIDKKRTLLDLEANLQTCRQQVIDARKKHVARFGYNTSRVPLQWQKKVAHSIHFLTPKFDQNYNPERHYDADPDRAEMKKVKALHQKEFKGAVRELKKDSHFLATEKIKQLKKNDSEYKKKMSKVMGDIGNELGISKGEAKAERKK